MADPDEKTGESPEGEEGLKSELEKVKEELKTAYANRDGYTTRKLEEQRKQIEAEFSKGAEGKDEKAELIRSRLELTEERKEAEKERADIKQIKMENLALSLAREHSIDASTLAEAKTETEMENLALKERLKKTENEPSQPSSKFDTSPGGSGNSDAEFVKSFGAGEIPVTKANKERYERIRDS